MSRRNLEPSFLHTIETLRPQPIRRKTHPGGPGPIAITLSLTSAVALIVSGNLKEKSESSQAELSPVTSESVVQPLISRTRELDDNALKEGGLEMLTASMEETAMNVGSVIEVETSTTETLPLP